MDILKVKVNNQWVGIPAIKGEAGNGVPSGGTTNQVLRKRSNTDNDTEWANPTDAYTKEETDTLLDTIPVDNLGDVRAKSIDLDELPKVCGFPFIIFDVEAPSVTPDFIGQMYIDTYHGKVYVATGVDNSSSFKVLN